QTGATCDFGAGITVNSCTFASAGELTASLTIAGAAAAGTLNVVVTNPDGQTATLPAAFTVTLPPPALIAVNPTAAVQGQTLTGVQISGSNFQEGATCDFGAGITVNSCTFASAGELTASL